MIFTYEDLNMPADYQEEFNADYYGQLRPEWIGPIYSPRGSDYAATYYNLHVSPSDTILVIGCGESHFSAYIASKVLKVWGIDDGSYDNFQLWCDTLPSFQVYQDGRFEFLHGNAASLPFPDNTFDKVTTISALEHFADDDDILSSIEVGRVLKSGGIYAGTVDFHARKTLLASLGNVKVYNLLSFFQRIVIPSGLTLKGDVHVAGDIHFEGIVPLFFVLEKSGNNENKDTDAL